MFLRPYQGLLVELGKLEAVVDLVVTNKKVGLNQAAVGGSPNGSCHSNFVKLSYSMVNNNQLSKLIRFVVENSVMLGNRRE